MEKIATIGLKIALPIVRFLFSERFRKWIHNKQEEKRKKKIQKALNKCDKDTVSKIMDESLKVAVLSAALLIVGCTSTVTYVDEDEAPIPVTQKELKQSVNEENVGENIEDIMELNVDGWWISNPRMKDILMEVSE